MNIQHLIRQALVAAGLALGLAGVPSLRAQEVQIVVNELCSSNIDQWVDPSFNYGGWVEFYNPSQSSLVISGWYLSDDPDHLTKAKIHQTLIFKPGQYLTLWFGHYDAQYAKRVVDMKLDCDGGTLYLSDDKGRLVTSVDYPEAVARCSYARTVDGAGTWSYCSTPTPGRSNEGSAFASRRLEAPVVTGESRMASTGSMTLRVTIPEGCTLRYTIDGSVPTLTRGTTSTTGLFSASSSRCFRFRLFADGWLPSPVVTRTFLRTSTYIDLPIVSIWGTEADFYGDSLGIFTKGVNGRPGRGVSDKANWNMDWRRPAQFDYFSAGGQLLFSQEVGIERCGGWSRAWEPWSFKIRSGKEYEGRNALLYPFFAEKPHLKQKTLQMRNGGNDTQCRVRDAALQQIVARSGLDVDYQAYQPVAHFINGVYRGTLNMREPNNKHFVAANYGYDDDEIDLYEMSPDSGYVQMCGTKESFRQWYDLARRCDDEAVYERICQMVDIDEYCNYMAVEFYLRNWDWPQNNVKAWQPHAGPDGRWRHVLFDLDGFDGTSSPFTTFASKQNYTFDQLLGVSQPRLTAEIEFVTLFLNMLRSPAFRKRFADTFCLVAGSVFEPGRCSAIISEMAERVYATQTAYSWWSNPWTTANDLVAALSAARQQTLVQQMQAFAPMQLSGSTPQRLKLGATVEGAQLLLGGMPVPTGRFEGLVFPPVTVEALPPAGYVFTGWRQATGQQSTVFASGATWRYYDRGSLDGADWTSPSYSDTSWGNGGAPLGYFVGGWRDYTTTLAYGGNAQSKYPTYYLRKAITLASEPSAGDSFELDFVVDDGCIVYVNGVEAGRYNMPAGQVTFRTYATTYAPGNPDTGSMTLPASLFHQGRNVIAVELHNNAANSTDVYWSASLRRVSLSAGQVVSADPSYALPTSGSLDLVACFEPLGEAARAALHPVVVNEVSASGSVYVNDLWKRTDWVELYNTTDRDIDLAGMYLTDKVDKPQKWQIASAEGGPSTVIPAHGYAVVWCDKAEPSADRPVAERALHAPFKLGNDDGGQVMLTAADGTWSDTLTYCAHLGTEAVGRYPDGSREVRLLTRPTLTAPNALTSYSVPYAQPTAQGIEAVTADMSAEGYAVYDLGGSLVATGSGPLRLVGLPSGVYVVRVQGEVRKVLVP